MKAFAESPKTEIMFLSLPHADQIAQAASMELPDHQRERAVAQYQHALGIVADAQRKAALIAVRVMRPHDYKASAAERRHEVRIANERHADRCLKVFSEYCTRGL